MTTSSPDEPGRAPPADPRDPELLARARGVRPPRRLWWLYLLIFFTSAWMGGGAAEALNATGRPYAAQPLQRCLADHGFPRGLVTTGSSPARFAQMIACGEAYQRGAASLLLIGAGLVIALTWSLVVGGGIVLRLRLRRDRNRFPLPAPTRRAAERAVERFEAWCDVWSLEGRHRPRLLLTPPERSAAEAFTTGLPLARALVVAPLGHAYLETRQFDAVILHELAHVRARDVLWASSVRWAGRLNVPVLLIGLVRLIGDPTALLAAFGTSLALALGLSASVLMLRTALLRRRELAADGFAIEVLGDAAPLRAALGLPTASSPAVPLPSGTAPSAPAVTRLLGAVRRAFALHPERDVRARADLKPLNRWEGGFAVTTVIGLITMFTLQVLHRAQSYLYSGDFLGDRDVAFAVACLLWAGLTVPALVRRAEAAAGGGIAPTWAPPVAGTLTGVTAGLLLPVPGFSWGPGLDLLLQDPLLLVPWPAVALTGAVLLSAGLAGAVPGGTRNGRSRRAILGAAILTAATVFHAALGTAIAVSLGHATWRNASSDRMVLTSQGESLLFGLIPVLLVGSVLAMSFAGAHGHRHERAPGAVLRTARLIAPRGLPATVAVAAATGALGAAWRWHLAFGGGRSADDRIVLLYQRWWMCALAGWAVAAVVLVTGRGVPAGEAADRSRRPPAGFAAALHAGLLTVLLAGVLESAITAGTGHPRDLALLWPSSRRQVWLFVVAVVVTAPVLVAAGRLAARSRGRAPAVSGGRYAALAAGAVAATLALALAAGVLAPLTTSPADPERHRVTMARVSARAAAAARVFPTSGPAVRNSGARSGPSAPGARVPGARVPGARLPGTLDAGRLLDQATAVRALAAVPALLPSGRRPVHPGGTSSAVTGPPACRRLFAQVDAAEKARPRTAAVTRTYAFPFGAAFGDGMTVTVGLTSYTDPPSDLSPVQTETRSCPHPTLTSGDVDGRLLRGTLVEGRRLDLPMTTYRQDIVFSGTIRSAPVLSAGLHGYLLAGHNVITTEVSCAYGGKPPIPNQLLLLFELLTTRVLTTVVGELQAATP